VHWRWNWHPECHFVSCPTAAPSFGSFRCAGSFPGKDNIRNREKSKIRQYHSHWFQRGFSLPSVPLWDVHKPQRALVAFTRFLKSSIVPGKMMSLNYPFGRTRQKGTPNWRLQEVIHIHSDEEPR